MKHWGSQYQEDGAVTSSISYHLISGRKWKVSLCGLEEVRGWMWVNKKAKLREDKSYCWWAHIQLWEVDIHWCWTGLLSSWKMRLIACESSLTLALLADKEVVAVARTVFYHLQTFPEKEGLATATHTLVTSRLNYCKALYVGLPLETTRKI